MNPCDARTFRQSHRQAHRTGTARSLHSFDPTVARDIFARENMRHKRMDETHIAFRPEISLGILLRDQRRLGSLDAGKDRGCPVCGTIDAHAKIDLVRARIGVKQLDQRQQRIGRLLVEIF